MVPTDDEMPFVRASGIWFIKVGRRWTDQGRFF